MNLFPAGKNALFALGFLLVCKVAASGFGQGLDQTTVQAAMTLKLLSFANWPEGKEIDQDSVLKVGVFGSEEAVAAFDSLMDDERYAGRYEVKPVDANTPAPELIQLEAIYFNSPEPTEIPRLLRKIEDQPIVLVGAFDGFLDEGGIVNIVKRQRRLSFEIHLGNAERRGIEFRSKLLRLATRIIHE